jgi:hypothetical protein
MIWKILQLALPLAAFAHPQDFSTLVCSKTDDIPEQYIATFLLEGKLFCGRDIALPDGLTAGFSEEDFSGEEYKGTIGLCFYKNHHVSILKSWWESNPTVNDHAALMYHELGHCILNRDHTVGWRNGLPDSLMYPHIVPEGLKRDRRYYMEELFGCSIQGTRRE